MRVFQTHRGTIVTLDRANVDTDQIFPKQFLKSIAKTGFEKALFYDWCYLKNGKPNPEFFLNKPEAEDASILVVRNNFGCGSSREHAVWAIQQYGFRAVIAPSLEKKGVKTLAFADIFRNNAFKNGLLTVELTENQVDQIFQIASGEPGTEATVDLEKQNVVFHFKKELSFTFEINPSIKNRLLQGLDDIAITLQHEKAIRDFEKGHNSQLDLSNS